MAGASAGGGVVGEGSARVSPEASTEAAAVAGTSAGGGVGGGGSARVVLALTLTILGSSKLCAINRCELACASGSGSGIFFAFSFSYLHLISLANRSRSNLSCSWLARSDSSRMRLCFSRSSGGLSLLLSLYVNVLRGLSAENLSLLLCGPLLLLLTGSSTPRPNKFMSKVPPKSPPKSPSTSTSTSTSSSTSGDGDGDDAMARTRTHEPRGGQDLCHVQIFTV